MGQVSIRPGPEIPIDEEFGVFFKLHNFFF